MNVKELEARDLFNKLNASLLSVSNSCTEVHKKFVELKDSTKGASSQTLERILEDLQNLESRMLQVYNESRWIGKETSRISKGAYNPKRQSSYRIGLAGSLRGEAKKVSRELEQHLGKLRLLIEVLGGNPLSRHLGKAAGDLHGYKQEVLKFRELKEGMSAGHTELSATISQPGRPNPNPPREMADAIHLFDAAILTLAVIAKRLKNRSRS